MRGDVRCFPYDTIYRDFAVDWIVASYNVAVYINKLTFCLKTHFL